MSAMAYREFVDAAGATWRVWDVYPQLLDRRASSDRRANTRRTTDRRTDGLAAHVSPGLAEGWLCFERASEKRRLAPIPADWLTVSDAALEALCRSAHTVPRPKAAGAA